LLAGLAGAARRACGVGLSHGRGGLPPLRRPRSLGVRAGAIVLTTRGLDLVPLTWCLDFILLPRRLDLVLLTWGLDLVLLTRGLDLVGARGLGVLAPPVLHVRLAALLALIPGAIARRGRGRVLQRDLGLLHVRAGRSGRRGAGAERHHERDRQYSRCDLALSDPVHLSILLDCRLNLSKGGGARDMPCRKF